MSNTESADDLTSGTDTPTDDSDAEITPVSELAGEIDPSDVWDTDHDALGVYNIQRHRNGDITVLQLSSFGDGYQILALEVNADGEILATEEVRDADDAQSAISACQYWLTQNPKGILGSVDDDEGGGGIMQSLGLGGD